MMTRPHQALFLLFCALAMPGRAADAQPATPPAQADRLMAGYPGQDLRAMEDPRTVWSTRKIRADQFVSQPNEWTCGSASYVMVLRALGRNDIGLDAAIALTCAREHVGSSNAQIVKLLQDLGPGYDVVSGLVGQPQKSGEAPGIDASVRERLERLLQDGYVVMINFREPVTHVGHYGVLQGINREAVEIADPYYGLRSVLPLGRFDFRSGAEPVLHGWYVGARVVR